MPNPRSERKTEKADPSDKINVGIYSISMKTNAGAKTFILPSSNPKKGLPVVLATIIQIKIL